MVILTMVLHVQTDAEPRSGHHGRLPLRQGGHPRARHEEGQQVGAWDVPEENNIM